MLKSRSLLVCVLFAFVCFAAFSYSAAQYKVVPRPCPSNEKFYECGASCQTECATLGQPCLISHFRCPDGCYCDNGYARDASGTCIPIDKCRK